MGTDFYISIGCLILAIILGISLARYNLKILRETKELRIKARRIERMSRKPWWYATVKKELARRKMPEKTEKNS